MHITLDTNVLVQVLSNYHGASAMIVDAILAGQIQIALSVPVFKEYEDVLSRPALQKKMEAFQLITPAEFKQIWRLENE